MIAMLRLSLLTAALVLPSLAFAADPPLMSQPADQQAAATAAPSADQSAPTVAPSMTWPSTAVAPAPPATHPTPGNIPPPPAGKGQVVFFRASHFKGAMITFMVREGDKELGKLGSGDYFVTTLDPGPHDFSVHTENHETLHMDIEAGETYYVSGMVTMGVLVGRAHLYKTESVAFGMALEDLKMSH